MNDDFPNNLDYVVADFNSRENYRFVNSIFEAGFPLAFWAHGFRLPLVESAGLQFLSDASPI